MLLLSAKKNTYPFQHTNNVASVIEGSDLFMTTPIHHSHSLKTHAFHRHLRCQQESMVEIIEKFIPVTHAGDI